MNTMTKTIQPRNASEALRYAKTMERAATGDFALWPQGDGSVTVDSFKTENGKRVISRYTVDTNEGTCTCPDFENRKDYCKHILRVDMVARQEAAEVLQFAKTDAEQCEMDEASYQRWLDLNDPLNYDGGDDETF